MHIYIYIYTHIYIYIYMPTHIYNRDISDNNLSKLEPEILQDLPKFLKLWAFLTSLLLNNNVSMFWVHLSWYAWRSPAYEETICPWSERHLTYMMPWSWGGFKYAWVFLVFVGWVQTAPGQFIQYITACTTFMCLIMYVGLYDVCM